MLARELSYEALKYFVNCACDFMKRYWGKKKNHVLNEIKLFVSKEVCVDQAL